MDCDLCMAPQMVHLIQDPKGVSVMDPSMAADKAMSIQARPLSTTGPPSQQEEVSQLKTKNFRTGKEKGIIIYTS